MRTFWIKLINLMLILFVITAYNYTVSAREQADEINRLDAEIENMKTAAKESGQTETEDDSLYNDGTYEGEAKGFGGNIKVDVSIESGVIADVSIVSAENEDGAYLDEAENIIDDIIESNSADVDTVSGATFSSTGIKNAVAEALKEAEK